MLVNTSWLLEYLEPACSVDDLIKAIPNSGLEVEGIHPLTEEPGSAPGAIVDLKVPPNRPYCLGLIGLAREIAAALDLTVQTPAATVEETGPAIEDDVSVEIKDQALCPRYTCRLIRGVKVAESPQWLKSRLLSTGAHPINNVVDVTNFVLREWGHPLHAFDHRKLAGLGIVVRKMAPSEQVELLDGTKVTGETGPLAIADLEQPVALAGIMGGKHTGVTFETVDVLLEAAYFDPVEVRRTSKRLGISTEASYRFERGMDPNDTLTSALDRAASLIAELTGGKIAKGIIDVYPARIEPRKFHLTSARVSSYLGTSVTDETVRKSLQKLGMKCTEGLEVEVPTYRADVNNAVVLIEDVARITGYDQIPIAPPVGRATDGRRNAADALRRKALLFLSSNGFLESRNVPMESPELANQFNRDSKENVVLANPLNVDLSVMRTSLLSGLVKTVSRNARRDADTFRYFEIDTVFNKADASTGRWSAAAVAGGAVRDTDWTGDQTAANFYYLKGVLENLLETAGVAGVSFRPATARGFARGQTAEVFSGETSLGVIGAINKEILSEERIKEPLFAFELDVERMLQTATATRTYEPFPRTPAVTRDLAIVVKSEVPYARLEQVIREAAGVHLEQVRCVDVYEGKHVPSGFRSVAVRLRFRAQEKTLSSDEVSLAVDSVVARLEQEFEAKLRA